MPLIYSISGVRGVFGDGLTPSVLVNVAGAFGVWCRDRIDGERQPLVVVGRDARVTGEICGQLVTAALRSAGCNVVDVGLATTPTVEMAVIKESAQGGVMLSASHNPAEWNALKLLNARGEFLTADEGKAVQSIGASDRELSVGIGDIGSYRSADYLAFHIDQILALPFISERSISARGFRIIVDGINSVGGVAIPALLRRLGISSENITCLNCQPDGRFAHNPEPLPEHLGAVMNAVAEADADLGIVVDPDADRLALIDDRGDYVGEELTQVMAADFLWRFREGPFVTNLSSSRAIDTVAARYGQQVYRSAVGEINVVQEMQRVGAILGGEGNGGVILPDLHYGRDALAGVALILQSLAERSISLSAWRRSLPSFSIAKQKVRIEPAQTDRILNYLAKKYAGERVNTIDGVKIDFDDGWVHVRKSNTEPIVRLYAEAETREAAAAMAKKFAEEISSL